jgi:hypothetical protein
MDTRGLAAVGLYVACLGSLVMFALRYWRVRETGTQTTLFADPMLRLVGLFTIGLLAVVANASEGFAHPLMWVVLIVGATVAGGDFILMLAAIISKNETFVDRHFKLETEREQNRAHIAQVLRAGGEEEGAPLPAADAPTPALPSAPEAIRAAPAPQAGLSAAGDDPAPPSTRAPMKLREQLFQREPLKREGWADAMRQVKSSRLEPVRVVVISSGVDPGLMTLFPRRIELLPELDRPPSSGLTMGTATTAFILAANPKAQVCSLNVFPDGPTSSLADLVAALAAARRLRPDLVFFDGGMGADDRALRAVVAELGVPLIAPSGNDGGTSPIFPAAYKEAISATAADGDRLADFANHGQHVTLAAPGVRVESVVRVAGDRPVFQALTGASAAAGLVTAAASLLLARDRTLDIARLRALLQAASSATDASHGVPILDIGRLLAPQAKPRAA